MSIFASFGAAPSNFTVPLTVLPSPDQWESPPERRAAVLRHVVARLLVFSFLLHAAMSSKPHNASTPTDILQFFLIHDVALSSELVFFFKKTCHSLLKRGILILICTEPPAKPTILPRTAAGRFMRFRRRLPALCLAAALLPCVRHRRRYSALLFRRQLEDVIGQQLAMISF